MVCDEWQVWRCRNKRLCNIYHPKSALGFEAWEHLDLTPNPTKYELLTSQDEDYYEEPSETELL